MNIEKKSRDIINKLLLANRCEEDIGETVNELLALTWKENFKFSSISYYYDKASHLGHYRDIAFILAEGKFNMSEEGYKIIKKLISLCDTIILNDILVNFLQKVNNCEDMQIYCALLNQDKNTIFCALRALLHLDHKVIEKLSYLSDDKQYFKILTNKDKQTKELSNTLKYTKKNLVPYMALIMALIRQNVDKRYIEELVISTKSTSIYSFYYDWLSCPTVVLSEKTETPPSKK